MPVPARFAAAKLTRRALLAGAMACAASAACGAEPARRPRLGVLFFGDDARAQTEGRSLASGLAAFGWVEGRTILIEWRNASGRPDQLAPLAVELVRAGCDLLVAGGPAPLGALRQATRSVPIVAIAGEDPVREGWAASLARPGGNVTGLTVTHPEIALKRFSLLKEALPKLQRAGILFDPDEIDRASVLEGIGAAARLRGIELAILEARRASDLESVFAAARESRVGGVLTIDTNLVLGNRRRIGDLALASRIPLVGEFADFGTDGALLAYGASIGDLLRRAGGYVDRILRGARPGDLPIERPAVFELIVNLRTARSLGIELPKSVLLQADRVLE